MLHFKTRHSQTASVLIEAIQRAEKSSFDVRAVLNQHHSEIRTRQQLKTEVWREAANTRKILRDYISGNL